MPSVIRTTGRTGLLSAKKASGGRHGGIRLSSRAIEWMADGASARRKAKAWR